MTPNPTQGAADPGYTNQMQDFREDADEAVQSARQQLAEVLDGITERAREYGRYADERVQANPWAAVGIGFGVGMAMGVLLAIAARR